MGESGTAEQARSQIMTLRPDVAVLDARLPDGSGIEVCRDIRAHNPALKALILTSYDDQHALAAAILGGASGFVLKQITGSSLVKTIRQVAAGQSLLDPESTRKFRERMRTGDRASQQLEQLTPQERRVLTLIIEGLTNRQIGQRLNLAEKTIKNYVSVILAKLGLQRRTQVAVTGMQLLSPHPVVGEQ